MNPRNMVATAGLALLLVTLSYGMASACTGITLKAKDGAVVFGRSMEWGSFDLNSRVTIVPRGYAFQGSTPDGTNGLAWKAKYGAVGLDAVGKDFLIDGMNEKGLSVNG